jgi:hypothetical protein
MRPRRASLRRVSEVLPTCDGWLTTRSGLVYPASWTESQDKRRECGASCH